MPLLLNNLSKYRSSLMGIAIIWIVLSHCIIGDWLNPVIKYLFCGYGGVGVDLFLLVSGFGIYFSLSKNKDLGQFLLKRIVRFLPAAPIFILFCYLAKITSFHVIVGYLTYMNYWMGIRSFGYLSYAFLCYVLSPIFFDVLNNYLSDVKKQILFILFLLILTIPFWMDGKIQGVSKVPIFVFGLYMGYYLKNNITITKKAFSLAVVLSLLSWLLVPLLLYYVFLDIPKYVHNYLLFYTKSLFAPGFCLFVCFMFSNFDKYKLVNLIVKTFDFLGKRSLEIFLIDSLITTLYKNNFRFFEHICLSIVGGILYYFIYHSIKDYIVSKYNKGNTND